MSRGTIAAATSLLLTCAFATFAVSRASLSDTCRAAKTSEAGKLGVCLLNAESKAIKKGVAAATDRCTAIFRIRWAALETKFGDQCPTLLDDSVIASVVEAHRRDVVARLTGGFGDIVNDKVQVEISGISSPYGDRNAVIVQGPGFTITRIPGFDGLGRPNDSPGFSTDIPLIFEHVPATLGPDVEGPALAQAFADQQAGTFFPTAASLILRNLSSTEVARWNMYEIAPVEKSVGTDGRDRYKWQSQVGAPTIANSEFAGGSFDPAFADEFNPATDNPLEIDGIGNYFPEVSDNTATRLLTLTMHYNETEGLYEWSNDTRNGNAGYKRSLSVLTVDPVTLLEVSRRNYFGTFPVSYRLVSGFALPEQTVIELVISYDWSEAA